jgi:hypothetical protein
MLQNTSGNSSECVFLAYIHVFPSHTHRTRFLFEPECLLACVQVHILPFYVQEADLRVRSMRFHSA